MTTAAMMLMHFFALIVLVTQIVPGASLNLQPEYIKDSKDSYVFYNIGKKITLGCLADEKIGNDIEWYRNGSRIEDITELNDRYTITVPKDKKSSKLVVDRAMDTDDGEYSCKARGHSVDFELVGRVIVKIPYYTNLVEGETLRLQCKALGSKFTIHWRLADNSTYDDGALNDKDGKPSDDDR